MNELARGFTMGLLSGSRSFLAPAMLSSVRVPAPMTTAITLLAAGEMLADKHPRMPARTDALPLAGRMLTGAFTAASHASPTLRAPMAIAGAAGGLCGTLLFYHLRRAIAARVGPGIAAGVVEDIIALGAGAVLVNKLNTRGA
jgi:uncharacterized membrane protein